MKNKHNYIGIGVWLKFSLVIMIMTTASGCQKKTETPKTATTSLPVAVVKTNQVKIYMHYMPWFQSKAVSGYWGSHWKMNTRNPDIIDSNGQREIASNYYPLIGPYDSKDKDVIDYHLLLMKYAGVDAILVDWYGSSSANDYGINLINTNTVISRLDTVGIQFGVVYEEYTAQNANPSSPITAAKADMDYVQTNYFSKKSHIRDEESVPILLTFGPRYFTQASQWTQIFSDLDPKPRFLPLWYQANEVGVSATGEFSWVDFTAGQTDIPKFYTRVKSDANWPFGIGSAFPRYDDYYVQGGEGQSYGHVDYNNGAVLKNTLAEATAAGSKYLQLITWNDFGEGTVFEPTTQDQFACLEILQQFAGVPYGHDELELVYTYYLKKEEYKSDSGKTALLEEIFHDLTALKVSEATSLLATLP